MHIPALYNLIIVLGIMIGIGIYITKWINFQGEVKKAIVMLIANVAVPCIILNSLFQLPINDQLFSQMGLIFLASIVVHCLGIGIGWIFSRSLRHPPQKAKELAILSGIGNTGFIGIPLCSVLFGPKGAVLAAVFDSGVDLVMWTLVVLMLQEKREMSLRNLKSLLNLPILAIVLGIVLSSLHVDPPIVFKELTRMLSSLTTPLAMLYIGMMVSTLYKETIGTQLRAHAMRYLRTIWNPMLLKLMVIPMVIALLLMIVRPDPELSPIVFILSATPTFTMSSIIFAYCKADEELSVVTTVVSTLLSLFTIPFVAWIGVQLL